MLEKSQKKLPVSDFFYAKGKPLIRMLQRRALIFSKAPKFIYMHHPNTRFSCRCAARTLLVGDSDADYRITLFDGVDNILSGYDFSEHGVLAIQVWRRQMCNEKLTTVGIRTCVGH